MAYQLPALTALVEDPRATVLYLSPTKALAADQLRVSDLNSTNGTFIDDKRVDRSAVLEVGSVLRIGNVLFKHEVRSRGEVQAGKNQAVYGYESGPREMRAAR